MMDALPRTTLVTNILQTPDTSAALRKLQRELDHFTDLAVELVAGR